jgi:hypothetical protein
VVHLGIESGPEGDDALGTELVAAELERFADGKILEVPNAAHGLREL